MKNLYYRFLLLLINKPFWQLIISILCILIIRVIFITIVFAESYVEDSSAELLLEEYLKSRDDVFMIKEEEIRHVKAISERVISDTKAKTIYELANPDGKTDGNVIEQIIQNEKKQTLFERADAHILEMMNKTRQQEPITQIISDIYKIANNVKNKSELFEQTMAYVVNVVPPQIFPVDYDDIVTPTSNFNLYMQDILKNYKTQNEKICGHLFYAAAATHGLVINHKQEFTTTEIEQSLQELLVMSYGEEILNHLDQIGKSNNTLTPYWKVFR